MTRTVSNSYRRGGLQTSDCTVSPRGRTIGESPQRNLSWIVPARLWKRLCRCLALSLHYRYPKSHRYPQGTPWVLWKQKHSCRRCREAAMTEQRLLQPAGAASTLILGACIWCGCYSFIVTVKLHTLWFSIVWLCYNGQTTMETVYSSLCQTGGNVKNNNT